jgi:DNA repair ATPase RecN
MGLLREHLNLIKQKFPEDQGRIENLYKTNEDFRALCEDYLSCIQHLKKFKKEFNQKQYTLEEYENMQKELEKELVDFLDE